MPPAYWTYTGRGGRAPHRLPAMVNRFLTFENEYYSGRNGIRHIRGTGAYVEVNQDPVEQNTGRFTMVANQPRSQERQHGSPRPGRPSPEDLFGSRISPNKNWMTVTMGRTSDKRGMIKHLRPMPANPKLNSPRTWPHSQIARLSWNGRRSAK